MSGRSVAVIYVATFRASDLGVAPLFFVYKQHVTIEIRKPFTLHSTGWFPTGHPSSYYSRSKFKPSAKLLPTNPSFYLFLARPSFLFRFSFSLLLSSDHGVTFRLTLSDPMTLERTLTQFSHYSVPPPLEKLNSCHNF